VCKEDLEEFIAKGFPYLARDKDANVAGNLFVDLRPTAPHSDYWDSARGELVEGELVDLLPILDYCKNRPSLRVQCGEHGCGCAECTWDWSSLKYNANVLFAISGNKKLQQWLNSSVEKVGVRFEMYLSFVMKRGHWKN
jgi:hypothetical protein